MEINKETIEKKLTEAKERQKELAKQRNQINQTLETNTTELIKVMGVIEELTKLVENKEDGVESNK